MARILIVGGGCRGLRLAGSLAQEGNAVRVTTRAETGREGIEAAGAECWIGTPDRLATLRGSLDRVAVLCWMLGTATGPAEELEALFTTRLEYLLTQAIDTTVRGFVYERRGSVAEELLAGGERLARSMTSRNEIPLALVGAEPAAVDEWLAGARAAIAGLLQAS